MNTHDEKQLQIRSDAFGKAVTLRLTDSADSLPHDITERLKAVRAQAVAKRKIVSLQVSAAGSVAISGGESALELGGPDGGWFNRVASLIPLLALVAGLVSIAVLQDDDITRELAEVDAELLTDDLPPAAFTDPGFVQYLRVNNAR
jgi:hypothetical protein